MRDLPTGWMCTTIGEVAEISSGIGFPPDLQGRTRGDYPFAKVGDVSRAARGGAVVIESADNWVERADLQRLRGRPLPAQSILFAKIGESIRLNYRMLTACEMLVDNNVMAVTPLADLIDPTFLLHFLRTVDLYPLAVATSIPSVRKTDVASVAVPLPPHREQQRILSRLGAVQQRSLRAREALEAVPALVERLRQSFLAAAFRGDLTAEWRARNPDVETASEFLRRIRAERRRHWEKAALAKPRGKGEVASNGRWRAQCEEPEGANLRGLTELPEGWEWATLDDLVLNLDGQRVPLRLEERARRRGPYPYYGASGAIDSIDKYIYDGTFLLIAEDGANLLSRSTPIAFIATDRFWVNNHAHVVQPIGLSISYLRHYLNGIDLARYVTGTAQPKLTQRSMNRIPVPVAPARESELIVEVVSHGLRRIESLERACKGLFHDLRELNRAVLTKAFRGEIVSQDPDDEPASALVERCRAQRGADWIASRGGQRAGGTRGSRKAKIE